MKFDRNRIQTDWHTDERDNESYREKESQSDRQADRRSVRQTDRQSVRSGQADTDLKRIAKQIYFI